MRRGAAEYAHRGRKQRQKDQRVKETHPEIGFQVSELTEKVLRNVRVTLDASRVASLCSAFSY